MEKIREWEKNMTKQHRDKQKDMEEVKSAKRGPARDSLRCEWENCGRICKTKTGLRAPQWMAHREKTEELNFSKCGESFMSHGVKQIMKSFVMGHQKAHAFTVSVSLLSPTWPDTRRNVHG